MALLVFSAPARAWEVYRSESGAILRWDVPAVVITLSPPREAGGGITSAGARVALDAAIAAWRGLDCGGPAVTVVEGERGLDEDDTHNTIVWVDDRETWTARFPSTELARTILIYRVQSGRLVDTDIAVNVAFFDFGSEEICDTQRYDLQGLFAHELGHVFGLDHSRASDATMRPNVDPGDCDNRTLSDDDRAGYCASYPPVIAPELEAEVVEVGPERVEVVEATETDTVSGRDEGCGAASGTGLWWWAAALGLGLRRCVGRARRYSAR